MSRASKRMRTQLMPGSPSPSPRREPGYEAKSLARAEPHLSHSQYSLWHERSPSSLTHSTVSGTSRAPPLSLTVQSLARAEPLLSHSQYSLWHEQSPSSLTHSTVTGTSGAPPLSLTVQSLARAEPHSQYSYWQERMCGRHAPISFSTSFLIFQRVKLKNTGKARGQGY